MKQYLPILRRAAIILVLCLLLLLIDSIWAGKGLAELRQHEDIPGQILYQSRQSIRDIDRQPWQVILFKRVIGEQVSNIELRLVGFPGQVTFNHPKNLILRPRNGPAFQANDTFPDAPMPSVGQYDLTDILDDIPSDEPLILELPTEENTLIKIPVSVILEWQFIS